MQQPRSLAFTDHVDVQASTPWLPPNPRAAGRPGERPINLEDAPLLAPLVVLDPFCWFSPSDLMHTEGDSSWAAMEG